MQLHARLGGAGADGEAGGIQLFSRKGIEHGDYSSYSIIAPAVRAQLAHDAILDGEMAR